MQLNNGNILLASLLGGQSISQINDFQKVQQVLINSSLPTISAIQVDKNKNLWEADAPVPESKQFFPFTFSDPQQGRFLLPFEPLLSITGKNIIKTSNVAKKSIVANGTKKRYEGTVKERWQRDDYQVKLSGVLIDTDMKRFPREYFAKLNEILISEVRWEVFCEPLQLLGINYLVVESFSFPFTKGENVQAYEIDMVSDFDFGLELTEDDVKIS
jgi:hypothetical protein